MRLLKIDLILIWANARNTICHWPRVSYDWLDVLRSTVLCIYLQFRSKDQAECTDRVISKAPALFHELPSHLPPSPSAPGNTTILVSPRECHATLLLLFTGYSITLSTSGRLIFLETHLPHFPLALYMQGIYHMKIWNHLTRLFY